MDKISTDESANKFLQDLGLRVDYETVIQVIDILKGRGQEKLFGLWASGRRRDGSGRIPICGKGTVYKIKNLYKNGELDPFLDYLDTKSRVNIENERKKAVNNIIATYDRNAFYKEIRVELLNIISDWEAEIALPLTWLDITDITMEKGNIPREDTFRTGITVPWKRNLKGDIIRKFRVEDRDEFKSLNQDMEDYRELWTYLKDCQQVGGAIIKACSELGDEIRKRSETMTGLKITDNNSSDIQSQRLDKLFPWTIFAEALQMFPEIVANLKYNSEKFGAGLRTITWGSYTLAVIAGNIE